MTVSLRVGEFPPSHSELLWALSRYQQGSVLHGTRSKQRDVGGTRGCNQSFP